ncbi:unnamed protein product [Ixodes persulcatus]
MVHNCWASEIRRTKNNNLAKKKKNEKKNGEGANGAGAVRNVLAFRWCRDVTECRCKAVGGLLRTCRVVLAPAVHKNTKAGSFFLLYMTCQQRVPKFLRAGERTPSNNC